jgi:hypothetical protein
MDMPLPANAPAESGTSSPAGLPRRLLGLNFALVLVLGVITILTNAQVGAQPATGGAPGQPVAAGQRGRGDYTLLSGKIQGGTSSAIYILDAANQELLALSWNRSRDELETIGLRRLADDARFNQGR